jgi:hypothetical protein
MTSTREPSADLLMETLLRQGKYNYSSNKNTAGILAGGRINAELQKSVPD